MEVGRIIGGKYRLRRQIGEGSMGAVWSAVHETLDRTVAIKFLRPSSEDHETASARFVREAKSAARVKHRFVVDVFDFGITEDGVYYMVQELLEGEELAECIGHGSAWEVRDVVQFVSQCLKGLEAVHQAGIVHRDLKPENIFVMRDADGRYPKLLDFGISKLSEGNVSISVRPPAPGKVNRSKQLTNRGTTLGTPWYMSPEQLRGQRDLDSRADIYSMGVIMYEWLTGRVPYAHENTAELALRIASGSAQPLVSLRPELGHALSSVVARALSPDPAHRFGSAGEMRAALASTVGELPAVWSVVQKSVKPPPALTQVVLPAIDSPLTEHLHALRRIGSRLARQGIKPWMVASAASFALLVLALTYLRDARPDRANAAEQPRTVASTTPAPQPEVEPRRPANAAAKPSIVAELGEPRTKTETRVETRAKAEPKPEPKRKAAVRKQQRAPKPAASAGATRQTPPANTERKVIRTLDF